jgi:adenosylhomocysteinase
VVVEIDGTLGPHESGLHRGLSAHYDGFRVMGMNEAARIGDIFITATGNKNVIGNEHFSLLKNGAILSNTGHFNVEIDEASLRAQSKAVRNVKENIVAYEQKDGRTIYLLSEGRLVNLAQPSGQGHPIEIMDGSFALQALCCELIAKSAKGKSVKMATGVHNVPLEVDDEVARLLLASKGIKLQSPTAEQKKYAESFEEGT